MPQINVKFTDEGLAHIDAAICRVDVVTDPVGQRSDYIRTAAIVAAVVETHETSLSTIVTRYRAMVRRARPPLSPAEWRLIVDACNGLWLQSDAYGDVLGEGAAMAVSGIPLEVSDAIRLNGLDGKHGVDGGALVARLAELAQSPTGWAQLCAIAHVVEVFWSRPDEAAVPGEPEWRE